MPIETKICGLKTKEAVEAAVASGSRYLGFVIYPPSPRYITGQQACLITEDIPENVKTVAVMVNPTHGELIAHIERFKPDYLQLHGNETPEQVKRIRAMLKLPIGIIKAIAVKNSDDINRVKAYEDIADILMFDTKPQSGLPGGTGHSFDWRLLAGKKFSLPWFLSGGLSAHNVVEAVRITGTRKVDVSSSLEITPGVKDPALIRQFNKTATAL